MKILELGHVVLYVTNVERVSAFYRDTLGFPQILSEPGMAMFSGGRTHHELFLIEVGGAPKELQRPEPGLYHIAFKIGDGPEAARAVYKELIEKGVRIIGTTDHGVTHSIYIRDPDGNELELYADISDVWKTNPRVIAEAPRLLDLS